MPNYRKEKSPRCKEVDQAQGTTLPSARPHRNCKRHLVERHRL